ncbi:hypothetical protein RB2150_09384 [Rhodobacterales bacterium HTCC2150]|nr:hypothetical protein RB2150_09384 [Rhodobacterales bacterium HTCC2150] [Rhodobacteraceae bacterium HTCC2150]
MLMGLWFHNNHIVGDVRRKLINVYNLKDHFGRLVH